MFVNTNFKVVYSIKMCYTESVMGGIYCLMGKSASGKDSLYRKLFECEELDLHPLVTYTTRPIRAGETDGVEYHFTDIPGMKKLEAGGRVIESRVYHTVHGDWYYFTADDGRIEIDRYNYLMVTTPEAYSKLSAYYGKDRVHPIYIEVEDGLRLFRALERERSQTEPKYKEMCRRFLADSEDFSDEKIRDAGIEKRFYNTDMDKCLKEIKEWILSV